MWRGWREIGVGNELIVYGKLPYGITGTQARFSGSEGDNDVQSDSRAKICLAVDREYLIHM